MKPQSRASSAVIHQLSARCKLKPYHVDAATAKDVGFADDVSVVRDSQSLSPSNTDEVGDAFEINRSVEKILTRFAPACLAAVQVEFRLQASVFRTSTSR